MQDFDFCRVNNAGLRSILQRLMHLLVLLGLLMCGSQASAQRVALVIGNANYSVGRLTNPPNDVVLMEAALRKLNFKVQTVLNANQNQMKRAVRDFGTSAQGADVAFMYFSGHGTQANGENYLLPVGASIEKESDYSIEAISANDVLQQIRGAKPKAAILVLDACRDNPMAATTRSSTKGLSRMDAPTGTMIAFATSPNTVASDNGDYARVLARELQKPGQELIDVFRNTTAEVRRLSAGKQEPRISEMSISDRLYLAGPGVQLASLRAEATGIPVAPTGKPGQSASLSLDDLEKEEATRKEWAQWQAKMKADFDRTAAFKGSPDLQAKAWERFLGSWGQDNPLSREDEGLREQARQRAEVAKAETARQAQAPAPTPSVAQLPISTTSATVGSITGAGASFPAPVYAKWASDYNMATGVKVYYQSIGSGAGIRQIDSKTVDFGASDMPQTDEILRSKGQMQFPVVMGGVVPVINVRGIEPGQLKLTGSLLADIFLGKVTRWNDSAIRALNPLLPLPDAGIAAIRRADGSGTTFVFTNYLSKVSPEWKAKVGEGTAVNWPVGAGAKGNEGMGAFVSRLPNSIGYVEYSWAKQNSMSHVAMQNAAGVFVRPDAESFKAAAASADWNKSSYQLLTNQPGLDAWPISNATFVLMHVSQDKPANGLEVLRFFNWVFTHGAKAAVELDYVPLPPNVIAAIQRSWGDIKDASGKAITAK